LSIVSLSRSGKYGCSLFRTDYFSSFLFQLFKFWALDISGSVSNENPFRDHSHGVERPG
jgi:hypothetical protein